MPPSSALYLMVCWIGCFCKLGVLFVKEPCLLRSVFGRPDFEKLPVEGRGAGTEFLHHS